MVQQKKFVFRNSLIELTYQRLQDRIRVRMHLDIQI